MHGFQMWLNLPAAEKMKPANYRDIPAKDIPTLLLDNGGKVKVIAGTVEVEGQVIEGPIQGLSTEPRYWDVQLPAGATFEQAIPKGLNAFVYVFEGDLTVGEPPRQLQNGNAGLLSDGDEFIVRAGDQGVRALVLAGKPIREPIAQYGPFVMNTSDEIEQAINDYRTGKLAG